jgi:hypothetical protein
MSNPSTIQGASMPHFHRQVWLTDRAVQNGATTLAESFLFMVAAGLVIGETWRSNRKEGKRRDDVRERLEGLEENMQSIKELLENGGAWRESIDEVRER